MSKGHGRVERAIIDLLKLNNNLSTPFMAVLAYQDEEPLRLATPAETAAVRRALSRLQKQGLVVKLGNMFAGERCSYANRESATAIAFRYVRDFGTSGLRHHPELAELYADAVSRGTEATPTEPAATEAKA